MFYHWRYNVWAVITPVNFQLLLFKDSRNLSHSLSLMQFLHLLFLIIMRAISIGSFSTLYKKSISPRHLILDYNKYI